VTDSCRAPERVQIFGELVEDADCPDLSGLQEIGSRLEELLPPAVASLCDGSYEIAWRQDGESPDRSMVLSRLPIRREATFSSLGAGDGEATAPKRTLTFVVDG
jgi:hypothetical protein